MKKVLILAWDFYPYQSVGAQRPWSWYRYFHHEKIHPIILTRHWDEVQTGLDYYKPSVNQSKVVEESDQATVIRMPYNPGFRDRLILKYGFGKRVLFRKTLTLFDDLLRYFLLSRNTSYPLYREARKQLRDCGCSAIIATGEPFVLFRYAERLSEEYNIPWIADYRDGWSTNINQNDSPLKRWLNRNYIRRIERNTVKKASCITTVSQPIVADLQKIFPAKKIHIVYNGYFSDQIPRRQRAANDFFTIAYVGSLYPFQRLEVFLDGFRLFLQKVNSQKSQICFFGTVFSPDQEERINKFPDLQPYIKIIPRLKVADLYESVLDSHLYLVLANEKINISCAKIFDYLALKGKILLVVNDHGWIENLIRETTSGIACDDIDSVCEALESAYSEYTQNGFVSSATSGFEQYSREFQARRLAGIIQNLETNVQIN
jgi:glycosyltransferase involved in cell wall biosynthesis